MTTSVENMRAARARARAKGLCGVCRTGQPRPGLRTCDVCIARSKTTKLRAQAAGRCRCGAALERGRKTCSKCLARNVRRRQRQKLVAIQKGLCTTCLKRPPRPDRSSCAECGALHAQRARERNARINNRDREAAADLAKGDQHV